MYEQVLGGAGLDARAAAIVIRTVRNIVNTGRTIVCTIHQPSIDIFESFDELLLLKRGGQTIYAGIVHQLCAKTTSLQKQHLCKHSVSAETAAATIMHVAMHVDTCCTAACRAFHGRSGPAESEQNRIISGITHYAACDA